MNASDIYTQRLTRYRTRPGFSISQTKYGLWLADDHLLQITRGPYRESYQRFYFRDIQALSLTRTRTHRILMAVGTLGAILLAGGLLLLGPILQSAPGADNPDTVVFSVLAIVIGFAALLGGFPGFMGPTCVCLVKTPIQQGRLDALCRWKRDLPIFEALCEKVVEAQGTLSEEAAAQLEAPQSVAPPEREAVAPLRAEPGHWHLALYGLLFVDAVYTAAILYVANPFLDLLGLVVSACIVAAAIGALAVQRRSTVPRPLRNLTAGAAAYVVVFFFFALVVGQTAAVFGGFEQTSSNPWSATEEIRSWALIIGLNWVSIAFDILLGLPGLAMTYDYRRKLHRARQAGQLYEGSR